MALDHAKQRALTLCNSANLPIYLSVFLCRLATVHMARLQTHMIYFLAHSVDVTNIFPMIICLAAVKLYYNNNNNTVLI